ncbi:hypothetical protein BH20CHL6_BH20CHL6_10120 [soil metagenome]
METTPETLSPAVHGVGTAPLRPLRVGLVSVRFSLFDPQLPADFPDRMRAHARRSEEILARHFEVLSTGVIEDEAGAAQAAQRLAGDRLDAVVFAPAMAAPPSYADIALRDCTAPLVIWNAPAISDLGTDLDQATATEHSTTVGAVMYANVLVRRAQPAQVVTAAHGDDPAVDRLIRTVRAVAAAGALRGATVLRVGDPIPGYLDVEADEVDLARLGLREHAVSLEEWEATVSNIGQEAAATFLEGLTARGWRGDAGPSAAQSARVALALETLLARTGAACGTVNCHGSWFRRSSAVGVVACLGVACQTLAGRPLACTGDAPTGILMYLCRRMAGAALYSECYAPDLASGLMLVAGGGEGDPAWADDGGVMLTANAHYPGQLGAGSSIDYRVRLGPATLLSLSPAADGWVLAWAPGEVVESRYRRMRGPNAMFRFDSGAIDDATSRWIASGATHHNALAPGRLDVEASALAAALGIREVRV